MDAALLESTSPETGAAAASAAAEPELANKRAIIDRGALGAEIDAICRRDLSESERQAEVLGAFKAALAGGRAEVSRRFEAGASGSLVVRANAYLADQLIRAIFDHATGHLYPLGNPSKGERLALVAVGGYGRGELAPYSDIDLLFLIPYKMTPRSEQVIEAILYLLWDLGLKVGQASRSIDDCIRQAKADMTIRTGLLEMRFLWGDQELYLELRRRFQREVQKRSATKFIAAKLAERDVRHQRQGGSRYSLEPHIKDGKGGLRDLHSLFWITKYLYRVDDIRELAERGVFSRREVGQFLKAQNFLWTLRCHLHLLTGRAEERLTFDLQERIAPLMGYTAHAGTRAVERFMKHYFLIAKDVGDLTRILCAVIEGERKGRSRFRLNPLARRKVAGFRLEGDRLSVAKAEVFAERPVEMLRIFKVAQDQGLDIHPEALRAIRRNLKRIDKALRADPVANRVFLEILTSDMDPETALRRMNEAGVFGRFIPDFGRVVAQIQYNMYHHYTVDEHTIFAIGQLHRIEAGVLKDQVPIASEVVHKVLSRRVLYLAVMLHDIAKGRPGEHGEVGAKVALALCPRLGLSAEETETVAWLVRHHLIMSHTAFTRDMEDPRTIEQFVELVQSMERLRLLLVLTVADIRAVGPGTWNAWKAALLRELYRRAEEHLSAGLATEGRETRVAKAKEALAQALADWPQAEIAAQLDRGTASYWLSADRETHVHHAHLVRSVAGDANPLVVEIRPDRYRDVTEVTVYAPDSPGLFSRIAGAIAVAGGSIDAAKIFTLTNAMALDSFYVGDPRGGRFDEPARRAKLTALIKRAVAGRLDPLAELARRRSRLPSRLQVFEVAPRVLIDNNESATHTVIEVNGRDRPGLLYHLTRALASQKVTISTAKISTFGERAVDVFYLQNAKGEKITSKAKLQRIKASLMVALADSDGREQAKGPRKKRSKIPAKV